MQRQRTFNEHLIFSLFYFLKFFDVFFFFSNVRAKHTEAWGNGWDSAVQALCALKWLGVWWMRSQHSFKIKVMFNMGDTSINMWPKWQNKRTWLEMTDESNGKHMRWHEMEHFHIGNCTQTRVSS
jgi:hypothetical protein